MSIYGWSIAKRSFELAGTKALLGSAVGLVDDIFLTSDLDGTGSYPLPLYVSRT
jgi:hypothetical protein